MHNADRSVFIDAPFWHHFTAVCEARSNHIALDDGSRRLTYAELARASLSLASEIAASAKPGDLIATLVPNAAELAVGVLACLACARPCLPLDIHHPPAYNARLVETAAAALVLTGEQEPGSLLLPTSCSRVGVAEHIMAPRVPGGAPTAAPVRDPAFVLYTSGSTGEPKGIVLSQRNLLHQVRQDMQACALHESDRLLALGSTATISPLRGLLVALPSGGTLYLRDLRTAGLSRILATFAAERISVTRIGPSLLRTLVQLPPAEQAFRYLRIIRVGGERLFGHDVHTFKAVLPSGCVLVFAYGSTEVPPVIQRLIPLGADVEEGALNIGTPLPGCDLSLIDEAGRTVAVGEAGELVVKGEHLALGHWIGGRCVSGPLAVADGDPDATFRTGDILRQRLDGTWEFLGRADEQVKVRGNRTEPGEAEAILREVPGVQDAAVIARNAEDLVAFIVPREADIPTLRERIRLMLAARLPDYARPRRLEIVTSIPRLATFKPDRSALLCAVAGLTSTQNGGTPSAVCLRKSCIRFHVITRILSDW